MDKSLIPTTFNLPDNERIQMQPTNSLMKQVHDTAVIEKVNTDTKVQEQIIKTADKTIATELKKIEAAADIEFNETSTNKKKSYFELYKEECKSYGITNAVSSWKVLMIAFGSGFWFIVYWIVASLTIAPICIFLKGIKNVIKQTWLAIIFAIVMYVVVAVGVPFLISYLR